MAAPRKRGLRSVMVGGAEAETAGVARTAGGDARLGAARRVRLWAALFGLSALASLYGLLLDRSIRPDPFDPTPALWDWLANRQPHPALARLPVVPAGAFGLLIDRPADTGWINSPYLPAATGAPPPAAMAPAKSELLTLATPAYAADVPDGFGAPPAQRSYPNAANPAAKQNFAPGLNQAPSGSEFDQPQTPGPPPLASPLTAQRAYRPLTAINDLTLAPRRPGDPPRVIDATCAPDGLHCDLDAEATPHLRSADGGRTWLAGAPETAAPDDALLASVNARLTGQIGAADRVLRAWGAVGGSAAEATAQGDPAPRTPIRSAVMQAAAGIGWLSTGWFDADTAPTRPTIFQTTDHGRSWQRLGYDRLPAPWVLYLSLPLTLLAAHGLGAAALDLRRMPPPRFSIANQGASDAPISWNDPDALGLQPLAYALSKFLRNRNTEPPLTIAIQGSWGSGKSSLMNLVAGDLRDYGTRPVWFNAWHHQKEEHLLAALLENIKEQAIPQWWLASGILFRLRLWWLRSRDDAATVLALLAIGLVAFGIAYLALGTAALAVLGAGLAALAETDPARPWWLTAQAWLGVGTIAGLSALVAAFRALRPLRQAPAALMASLRARARLADFSQQIGFRYRFAKEFGEVCRALRSSRTAGMVILIDDLDRCQPANVLELLEAVNFLTSAGPCFIFLGIDEQRVLRAMTRCLDADEAEARAYLEKLVNLSVPIPKATALVSQALLGGQARPEARSAWPKRLRRFFQDLFDRGPGLLALGTLAAAVLIGAAMLVSGPRPGAPAGTATPAAAAGPGLAAPAAESTRAAPRTVLAEDLAPGSWMPHAVPLLFVLVLVVFLTVARLLAPKPETIADSADFREALRIWNPVIFHTNQTPRAVKRYQNRLRLMATALQDNRPAPDWIDRLCARFGSAPPGGDAPGPIAIPETMLVALGAIEASAPDALRRDDLDGVLRDGGAYRTFGPADAHPEMRESLNQFSRRYPDQWPPSADQVRAYLALSQDVRIAGMAAEGPS